MADGKPQPAKDALLEDLESIRTALDKDRRDAAGQEATSAEDEPSESPPVPLRDDPLDGGLRLDEIALSRPIHIGDSAGGLDDALFEALLGDSWKTSADTLLDAGRAEIEAQRNRWAPEDTDKLNEALRERIDTTLKLWLREVVSRNLDDLRQALLAAVAAELKSRVAAALARDADPTGRGHDEKDG
jgi:hypothetical protein